MNGHLCTCNMAEALYLLRRCHRVVNVEMVCTWPYGMEECAIGFEGENLEADHLAYISGRIEVDLRALPELFAAIASVLPQGGAS